MEALYIKPKNEIFAHHLLATRRQQPGESLDEYLQALKAASKDCNFKAVTAAQYREESTRDAFISGIQSSLIRQRLLENKTLDLATMFDQARAQDAAQKSSEQYSTPPGASFSAAASDLERTVEDFPDCAPVSAAANTNNGKCFFCGYSNKHQCSKCPARKAHATSVKRRDILQKSAAQLQQFLGPPRLP